MARRKKKRSLKMSIHRQQLHGQLATGHAVCIALIRVDDKHFVVVGTDSQVDDEDILEVARASASRHTVIVRGGSA